MITTWLYIKQISFYYIQAIDNTQVLEKVLKLLINTLNF